MDIAAIAVKSKAARVFHGLRGGVGGSDSAYATRADSLPLMGPQRGEGIRGALAKLSAYGIGASRLIQIMVSLAGRKCIVGKDTCSPRRGGARQ